MKYSATAIRIVKIDEVAKVEMNSVSEASSADLMKMTRMPGTRLGLKVEAVTSLIARAKSSGGAEANCARVSARTVLSRSQRTARNNPLMSRIAMASRARIPESLPSR